MQVGIPSYLSNFVGRQTEYETLRGALAEPARLITVVGAGGAGKTRIVAELARELASDPAGPFPDGVTWTDLAPVTDPDQVALTTAGSLGTPVGSDGDPLAAVIRFVVDRRLLLILDNCEQVAAACQSLIGAVLAACPQVAVLATSRTALGAEGERVLALPPMSSAEGDTRSEAAELFYDRASRLLPGYPLLADDLPTVNELCRRLDGLPLAIELAAPWVRTLSARDLLTEFDRSADVLVSADPSLLTRHRSMRVVWDSTWRSLTVEEQRALGRASVFRGGFTRDAGETVLDASAAVLRALADRALIRQSAGAGDRYVLHEVVRQFAGEHLQAEGPEVVEAVRQAHLDYFLDLYERGREDVDTPREGQWRLQLNLELPNAESALAWTLDSGRAETALRLTAALSTVWIGLGRERPHLGSYEAALSLPWDRASTVSTIARARVLSAAGFATMQNGGQRAVRHFEEATSLYAAMGDEVNHARGLSDCGFATRVDDPIAALGYLRHGRAICERIGDPLGIAWLRNDLGEGLFIAGQDAEAEPLVLDALRRFERLGVSYGVLVASIVLGHAYRRQHRWREAVRAYAGALAEEQESMDDIHGGDVLAGLAVVAHALERPDCAAWMFGAGRGWDQRTGSRSLLDPRRELAADRAAAEDRRSDPDWATRFAIGLRLTREQALEQALQDAEELLDSISAPLAKDLTVREVEVVRLVAEGLSDADIARRLGISPRTVHTHLSSVYRKLNVKSRTAAVRELRRLKLLESASS